MSTSSFNPLRYIGSGLAVLTALSCGGGDGDGGGGPSPSFTISAPTTLSVQAGSSGTVQVGVTRAGGFAGTVTLDLVDHPDALTHSFAPAVVPGSSSTATMTVFVSATVAPGTYTIKLCGNASGFAERDVMITLTVTAAPAGSFSLSLASGTLSLGQSESGTVAVTISRTAPFTGEVALQILITPPGVMRSFEPAVIPAGATSATLTVTALAETVPGSYTLMVSGTATGVPVQEVPLLLTVTANPGNFSVVVAPDQLKIEQGKSAKAVITIERTAPFAGPVSLSVRGAPTGVVPALSPATIPAGGTTAELTLSVSPVAAAGFYPLTIAADGGDPIPEWTAGLLLEVKEVPGFTLQAVGAAVQQGQVGAAGINVHRKAGFAGEVHLAIEGTLPAGVTATLDPAVIPPGPDGPASAVVFSVQATSPVGQYPLTLRGTADGVPEYAVPIMLEVRVAPSGNVTFTFCNPTETPIWFGYRNGTGPFDQWTQVAGPGGVFNFPITAAKGGVAWVTSWTDEPGYYIGMFLGTQAELAELGTLWCRFTPVRKSHTGSVANAGSEWYTVSIGDASVEIHGGAGTNYQLNNVPVGLFDLVAIKTPIPVGASSSTMILRRGINYPSGGVIPLLDFAGGEEFLTTTRTAEIQNLGTEAVKLGQAYVTAGGTIGVFPHRDPKVLVTPYMVVPAAKSQPGDLYNLKLESSLVQDGTVNRMVVKSFEVPDDQVLTLGPALTQPSVFQLQTAPLYQVRVVSAWQPEYANLWTGKYFQDTRDGEFYVTAGYLGGGAIDVTTPDLRTVPGWNATWGPISGVQTVLRGMAYGWTGTTGALFPGFLGDFLTSPNLTVRTAALYMATVP